MGTAVSQVVLPIVGVRELHAGPFVVSCLAAAGWLPWAVFGLLAGAWVDRLRKRPMMIICDLISLLLFASIAVASWLGLLTIVQLLLVALLAGVVSVFFKSAFQAFVPNLLDKEELMAGNARLQGSVAFAEVSGPGFGGAIAQFAGVAVGVLVNAFSFLISAICLASIRSDERRSRKVAKIDQDKSFRREIIAGLLFLADDPYLRPLAVYTSAICLGISGADSLLVIFFIRTVGISASMTGVILALMGIGGLFGAGIATRLVRLYGSARALLVCRLMLASALLLPLTTHGVGVIFSAGWVVVSAGVVAGNVMSLTFRQARCPSHMLGRISASYTTLTYTSMALGAALAGALGTLIGVRPALWVMGIMLASSSAIVFFSPIRHVRDLPEPAQ
jgi:predicted MFS family arabinose efflux permease